MKHYWSCPYCYTFVPLFRSCNVSSENFRRRIVNHLNKRHSTSFKPNEINELITDGLRVIEQIAVKKGGEYSDNSHRESN